MHLNFTRFFSSMPRIAAGAIQEFRFVRCCLALAGFYGIPVKHGFTINLKHFKFDTNVFSFPLAHTNLTKSIELNNLYFNALIFVLCIFWHVYAYAEKRNKH